MTDFEQVQIRDPADPQTANTLKTVPLILIQDVYDGKTVYAIPAIVLED
jgi:hypothetical protein